MSAVITIVGRCIKIEEREVGGGHKLVNVSVPIDCRSGKADKETTWWQVDLWGNSAEGFLRFIKPKDVVMFTGHPHVREYTREDGAKGYSPTIKSAQWAFVPRSEAQAPDNASPNYGNNPGVQAQQSAGGGNTAPINEGDDLPF